MVMASRLKGTGWLVEGQNKYQMKAAALAISPLLGMNMIDMRLTHPGLDEGCLAIFEVEHDECSEENEDNGDVEEEEDDDYDER